MNIIWANWLVLALKLHLPHSGTIVAELTQLCKANTLSNAPLSTAYHTQCQSASNHDC